MSENLGLPGGLLVQERPMDPTETAMSYPELAAEVNAALAEVDEAYATGRLTVPEALSDTTRDQKGPSGHDASRMLYHS